MIALVFLATVINYLDRQTLSVVAPVLRDEFRMSNETYGRVVAAFMLAYTVMNGVSGPLIDRLVLHLLANTGNKSKKLRTREEFLPIPDVKVRLRLPAGRRARSVTLLRSRRRPAWHERAGWVELTVPQVLIHEAVHLELA